MASFLLTKSLSQRINRYAILRRPEWAVKAVMLALFRWVCARLRPDRASAFGRGLPASIGRKLRKSTPMSGNLALAFGELDGTRFRVTLCKPIRPHLGVAGKKDQAIQMMIEDKEIFERWIRERPEQWLCTMRAWSKELIRYPAPHEAAAARAAETS